VVRKIALRSTGRAGYGKILVADMHLERFPDETSRPLAYFSEPDDTIGTRLPVTEKPPGNEMYMYTPSLFKVRRINPQRISSSMYGSDFSRENIERFYGMLSSEQPLQVPDTVLDGEPMYVPETRPDEASGSRYSAVVAYFDRQDCVVRRVDFLESGERLRKQPVVDPGSMATPGSIKLPRDFVMAGMRNNTRTSPSIRHIEPDLPIDDATFDHGRLKEFRGIN